MKTILIAASIILLMMIYSCAPTNEQSANETAFADTLDIDTTISADTNSYEQTEPIVQAEAKQTPTFETSKQEIVNFRVQNSFVNTDKTHECYITINEESKIMTLTALNGVDVFTLTSEGDGVFNLNFFKNRQHEATKTVYRRTDLEDTTDTQIYSSRTGEIILTLSYP